MGIVVLGAVFVDIKGYPQDVYIPGGRNAGRIEQVPGGVSRNVVEDIANVELRPTFVSLVDDTGLGEDVVRQLRNHKVNTDYMLRTPDGMGTWLAVFNNDGDVCAAISKRPDLRPLIALLDEKGDEIFRDADSIALELDMDKEIVKRVFAYAQKYHKSVYAVVSNMTIAVERLLPGTARPCTRHDRRGRRILRGHHHRLDLRQGDAGCLRHRHAPCGGDDLHARERLPALHAGRIRAGGAGHGLTGNIAKFSAKSMGIPLDKQGDFFYYIQVRVRRVLHTRSRLQCDEPGDCSERR